MRISDRLVSEGINMIQIHGGKEEWVLSAPFRTEATMKYRLEDRKC